MAEEQTNDTKSKNGGTKPQIALYQKIASHEEEIIQALLDGLHSRNESIKIGAAKILINKILPDLRQMEVTGKDGGPIKLNIISGSDYISYTLKTDASPEASIIESVGTVQGADMAQTGKKNNNSNNPDNQVDTA